MSHDPRDPSRRPIRWRLGLWALVATAAAGAGGYYAWQFRSRAQQSEAAAAACAAKADATLTKMESSFKATRQELEDLRKWKSDTAKRMQTFRDMSKKLQKMVDAGRLGVRVRDGRLVVRLPEDVLFPSGSSELSREGELALMEVAIVLRQFPDRRFMAAGHTDNTPIKSDRYKDNWELSMARALVVTRFLVEAKMPPQNIVAAGYGEFDPIASNDTPKGRSENRRIELVLLPDLSELPTLPEDLAQAAKAAPEK